jgi:hypothetical protein
MLSEGGADMPPVSGSDADPLERLAEDVFHGVCDELGAGPRVPVATYRVQMNAEFDFARAEQLVGYLHDLGVSHLYSSPFF